MLRKIDIIINKHRLYFKKITLCYKKKVHVNKYLKCIFLFQEMVKGTVNSSPSHEKWAIQSDSFVVWSEGKDLERQSGVEATGRRGKEAFQPQQEWPKAEECKGELCLFAP